MVCIKGASRLATLAFAPDSPYLAAGTMAGAVDLSFSSSANLEIFKVDFQSADIELPVVGECSSSERFNRLSWGKPTGHTEEFALGLVAGGLADGSVGLWNPLKLISGEGNREDAMIQRLQRHTGPVRGLAFNMNSPEILASGADGGEVCIWDLENPTEPKLFPALRNVGAGAQSEVSFLTWNPRIKNILASCLYNGTTVVWDLVRQKSVISFTDPHRQRCSVLQWHPDNSTQLIVASDDDRYPSLCVWDVRNTMSPAMEFVGHTKGVLAMSWCPHDTSYLLTCAKDNRTICWDTHKGEIVCEVPASTNWNFDIHWYPRVPGIISASSFDGKIGVYNIEACARLPSTAGDIAGVNLRAPKWLKCQMGATFGFGGKLVSFKCNPSSTKSEVYIHNVVTESSLVSRSNEFEAAIQNGEKSSLRNLCERKSQESESEEERETWGFLKVMFEDDGKARTKLLGHLGFNVPSGGATENVEEVLSQEISKDLTLEGTVGEAPLDRGDLGLSSVDNGDDFFNNLESPKADLSVSVSGNDFPVESCGTPNGALLQQDSGEISHSSFDEVIQHALVVGDYKGAVEQCISANRMADALVIAHLGSPSLWESTRDQYLKKNHSSYLKVVLAMVNNDLMNLVKTRPLHSWKETLALLCSFAQGEEWTLLCDTLALRLIAAGNTLAATLCYICAGNIDKTVEIWSSSLKSNLQGKTYVDLLQDLMEKTIVLALATGQKQFSASLTKLVENYAELLASQGLLTTAREYLKLLAMEDSSVELAILRDRIAFSVEETERPVPSENILSETQRGFTDPSSFGAADALPHYYQEKPLSQPNSSVPGSPYGEAYQQPFRPASYEGGYQPMQVKQQFQDYMTTSPFPPASLPQMFVPSQATPAVQTNFGPSPVMSHPAVRPFVPATPPVLKNVEQYQQPTFGSQPYSGVPNPSYQSIPSAPGPLPTGPPITGPVSGAKLPQTLASGSATRGFAPVHTPGLTQPGMIPVQPSHPAQAPVQSVAAPPAPPATVQTVDTSKVPSELKLVIATLTRLYNETEEALGGSRANPAKRREIEDNSRKIGSLFAKLNSGDISPNASSKLCQLCQALDSGDFAGALHIQVLLTTSDWDECNFWLAALKRMIKTRQNVRIN